MSPNLAKYKAKLANRYNKQLERLNGEDIATSSIEVAVDGAIQNLTTAANGALVIYGDPHRHGAHAASEDTPRLRRYCRADHRDRSPDSMPCEAPAMCLA
ncbi:hypothetical protein AA101099_0399 [Neoasaia chiangmaiensis NBRC 101099]|nr:hypothetical protein AA101099_0399 [Neoasaia chiangmaiensis NBRC 101099]GEN15305.1 hypothetical protein NCH01_17360 [Neoasaia chiangmaiensis]